MPSGVRPADNPFRVQRTDALRFVEFDLTVEGVAQSLLRHGNRGALVGPHGTGKTTLLGALGDCMVSYGLSPMPLFMNREQRGTFPLSWRKNVARARASDLLMLDGYDLLPGWARAWVLWRSRGAGGLVVTAHRHTRLATIANTRTSPVLLEALIRDLEPAALEVIDPLKLWRESRGDLRVALRRAYDLYGEG